MPDTELQQLAQMALQETKAARRRATVLVQIAARLKEAADNDSPKEGTRNECTCND